MKFIIVLLFLFFNLKSKAQTLEHYLDSISNLMIENRIIVFDSTQRPIPHQTILEKYVHTDTSINCMWTRPKFIDNIYHSSFDGVVGELWHSEFDTSSMEGQLNFISFTEKLYDDNGNYIQDRWAFMLKRNAVPRSSRILKKIILKSMKPSKASLKILRLIRTRENELWRNEYFSIGEFPYSMDSCMSEYSLQLKRNFHFEQGYSKDSFCTTTACLSQKSVGTESETNFFLNLSERVQYYKLENRKGYWTIQRFDNKEFYLVLYSRIGKLIAKYKIKLISPKRMILLNDNQKIVMKKSVYFPPSN